VIVCRKCNSRVKFRSATIPDWYDGDFITIKDDYFECPECGRVEIDEVIVITEKKTKGGKNVKQKKVRIGNYR